MLNSVKEEDKLVVIDITPKYGFWKPTIKEDKLKGKLLSITSAPYKGRPNKKYCLETDHPESVNGKIMFYGTYCINKALDNPELIGKIVIITYKGETTNTNNPIKKPLKKFKIELELNIQDPLYTKYTTHKTEPNNIGLKKTDDTEIEKIIQEYTDIYSSTNPHQKITHNDIIKLAETDPELSPTNLKKVKKTLKRMIKSK